VCGTDTLGRILAIALGEVLRQQIVIDNRPGAGGTIGMEIGRNANPDGYTIIFASPPSLTIAPFVQKRQPFDPVRDFEFVATVALTPNEFSGALLRVRWNVKLGERSRESPRASLRALRSRPPMSERLCISPAAAQPRCLPACTDGSTCPELLCRDAPW
jgi:hypothetical protein